jgi:hypothetical protein
MPRHVVTMIVVVAAFFGLLWIAVVLLGQSAGRAMLLALLTLFLIGVGITFTASSIRDDEP